MCRNVAVLLAGVLHRLKLLHSESCRTPVVAPDKGADTGSTYTDQEMLDKVDAYDC